MEMAGIGPCAGGLIDSPQKSADACTALVKAQARARNSFQKLQNDNVWMRMQDMPSRMAAGRTPPPPAPPLRDTAEGLLLGIFLPRIPYN
jgi:hypothetical protein